MNIEHFREFAELSRQLNFSSAAQTLHLTQPALSNHVKSMEQELGVTLVERSSSGNARLTPAGQIFLEQTQQILEIYDDMVPRLHEAQCESYGKILVRTPRNEYSKPFLNYVQEFHESHPRIDVIMLPWSEVDGFKDVDSHAADCAYISCVDPDLATPEYENVGLVAYTQTEIYLWVDKGHRLAQVEQLDVHDLDGASILIPANKKHDSWQAYVDGIIIKYGLSCRLRERYCDSLEDLMLTKVHPSDFMLCSESLVRTSSALQIRSDRVARRFTPPLISPECFAYYKGEDASLEDQQALAAFVSFMEDKYENCLRIATERSEEQGISDL